MRLKEIVADVCKVDFRTERYTTEDEEKYEELTDRFYGMTHGVGMQEPISAHRIAFVYPMGGAYNWEEELPHVTSCKPYRVEVYPERE